MIYQTRTCVLCERTPTVFAGHVRLGSEHVIAGWCQEHYEVQRLTERTAQEGFSGLWSDRLGLKAYEV